MADSPWFHLLEALVLALLAGGVLLRVRPWLLRPADGVGAAAIRARRAARRVASLNVLRAVLLDGALQRRLFRRSRYRWLAHQLIFWSFLELFFIGSLGDMFGEGKDVPWFAFLNDLGGLALLAGCLGALAHWLGGKRRLGRRSLEEPLIVGWLAVLAVSGFVVEAARYVDAGSAIGYAFGGYVVYHALEALGASGGVLHEALWWTHAALAFTFIAYLPIGLLRHVFAAPAGMALRAGAGANGAAMPGLSPLQRVQLDACVSCAECTRWCEAFSVIQPELERRAAPSLRLADYRSLAADGKAAEGGWQDFAEAPYLCTMCSRCAAVCPQAIDLPAIWRSARQDVASRGLAPNGLNLARQAVADEHNVVNYPNIERALWVDYANAPADGWQRERADVFYFVGCMTSFSPAAQNIAVTFAEVMEHAGVDFALLGGEEWCCGFPFLVGGMAEEMDALRRHNIERLERLGAKAVVFSCPSCFHTWKKYYGPYLPEDVELYHSTQFLAKLLAEGKLRPAGFDHVVTYHDPCDLGRNTGVFEEPRQVLRALTGLELREPEYNRELAHCCGGGGDLEMVKPDLAATICAKTLGEFEATGAETLVVACPQCKRMFQNAARKGKSPLEVIDIIELVHKLTVGAASATIAAGRDS